MTQRNSRYSHCLRRFASSESSPTLLGSDSLRDQWTGDNQHVFHRKRPCVSGELLAVLASHVLTWTLACENVRVFKHKSVWWLSIVIDGFIHADGDFFFFTAWCAPKADAHVKSRALFLSALFRSVQAWHLPRGLLQGLAPSPGTYPN